MRTKLYLASTEALADEARFLRLSRTLPDARREKLASLRHPGARRLSLGAGLLLNYALRSEGLPPTEYAVTEHGKPFFPALPDFCFNLSHSGRSSSNFATIRFCSARGGRGTDNKATVVAPK